MNRNPPTRRGITIYGEYWNQPSSLESIENSIPPTGTTKHAPHTQNSKRNETGGNAAYVWWHPEKGKAKRKLVLSVEV